MAYCHCQAFIAKGGKVLEFVVDLIFPTLDSDMKCSTIGAGDTFIAGMLHGLLYRNKNWTLQQVLNFANELAGRKVVQEGFAGLVDT